MSDLFDSYTLRIRTLTAQSKHFEVIKLVNEVAGNPTNILAEHDLEIVPILLAGHQAAFALGDYESAIHFIKLDKELHEMAIERKPDEREVNKLRTHFIIFDQLLAGSVLSLTGDYEGATQILTKAAKEAEQASLPALKNRILVSLGCAKISGRRQIQEGIETLTNVINNLEEASSDQFQALAGLAWGYTLVGEQSESERINRETLRVAIKAGKFDRALTSLRLQANDLISADRLIEARECLENALRALESYPDKFQNDRFDTLTALAVVHTRLLDIGKANLALESAWKFLPQANTHASLAESNLTVAALCSIESELCETILQTDLQLRFAQKSHSIKLQSASSDPLLMAQSYLSLGQAYVKVRDFPKAMTCLASAKSEAAKLTQPNFDLNARLLDRLALAYSEQGDLDNAVKTRLELLDLAAQKFGKADTRYFGGLRAMAGNLFRLKSFEKASELCVESQLLSNEHAWRDLAFLQPGQNSGVISDRILLPDLACLVALSTTNKVAIRNAAYVLTLNKGLETEIWSAQAKSSDAVRSVIGEYWANAGTTVGRDQASQAYQARDKSSVILFALLEGSRVSFDTIQKSIPADAVLIDFARFGRYDSEDKTNSFKEEHYAALLTFPLARDATNIVVERVDLGEAAPINEAVELVCKRMSAGQFAAKDLPPALQKLSQLVYAPLAPYLTNVSHLIVCPDGQLSRLPFEMLPVANKFLVEEKTISYVTSGREVVRLASPKSNVQTSKSLVMGNPDFDLDLRSSRGNEALTKSSQLSTSNSQPKIEVSLLTSSPTRSLSREYRGLKFNPLPGSGVEATNVAGLLGTDATLRLGADAREAELKAVASPRVLHLATHGFFLSDQDMNREIRGTNEMPFGFSAGVDSFSRGSRGSRFQDWENPLVRCGIALAGANHATNLMSRNSRREEAQTKTSEPSTLNSQPKDQSLITSAATRFDEEDGLLTGLEASLLNLQGTELVILSACDSGTGEVKIGEGVMSLRRAFRIAGAESVLASHWPVSDKATSQLMTEFMRRWRSGEPRAKAWREAQLSLLHSNDFSNPYFWAAFTLTGQWN